MTTIVDGLRMPPSKAAMEIEARAQWRAAMPPQMLRAAAYLHDNCPRLPYAAVYELLRSMLALRALGVPREIVRRTMLVYGVPYVHLSGVLGKLLTDVPDPKPLEEIDPEWAALTAEERTAAWDRWRADPLKGVYFQRSETPYASR